MPLAPADPSLRQLLRAGCTRFLTHHPPVPPGEALRRLADELGPDEAADSYGAGALIEDFEREVAALLGKPAAVFMPSGTMAQPIAARIWCARAGSPVLAMHPTSHLELHEQKGYQALHGLRAAPLGPPDRLPRPTDLDAIPERVGCLLVELPQRELGGALPGWDELAALTGRARARGIALHLDGARLWECGPGLGRPYGEIAGLFDSVYVSFYKGLGGLAGAVLAGPADFVGEARVWQRRQGGNLVRLFPYVLSARLGLRERLGRMAAYVAKAGALARVLGGIPGLHLVPDPPPTNMFHLWMARPAAAIDAAQLELARRHRTWLFPRVWPAPLPGYSVTEFTVGDATMAFSEGEVAELLRELLERARPPT